MPGSRDPLRLPTDAALGLALGAAAVAVFVGVIYRYVLNDPISWIDEFATLVFGWVTLLGAAVAQRTDSHMAITLLARQLPARGQAVLFALRVAAIAAVLAVLFWQGWLQYDRMSFIEFPAMEISRGWLYALLPVGAPLIGYYLVRSALQGWAVIRAGGRVFDAPEYDQTEEPT